MLQIARATLLSLILSSQAIATPLGLCEIFEDPLPTGSSGASSICDEKSAQAAGKGAANAPATEWNTVGLKQDRFGLFAEGGLAVEMKIEGTPTADATVLARIVSTQAAGATEPRAVENSATWMLVVLERRPDGSQQIVLRHYAYAGADVVLVREVRSSALPAAVLEALTLQVDRRADVVQLRIASASFVVTLEAQDFGALIPWVQLRGPNSLQPAGINDSRYAVTSAWAEH